MQITNTESQQISKEEAMRFKKKMMLEAERESIRKQLQEMEECDMMDEGFMDKVGQFMGTKWTPEKAQMEFNKTYTSPKGKQVFQNIMKQFNVDAATLQEAMVDFMIQNAGAPILAGAGQNATWDQKAKKFVRKSGGLGGGNYGQVGG